MGQAAEKVKLQLAGMGYGGLPITYRQDEQSVLRDEVSGRKLKKYTVVLNPGDVEDYLSHLQFRSTHPQHLIQVVFAQVKKEELDYCKLFVYLEQICLSLEEIVCTHFLNMVKILYSSLHGFKALFEKYGYFTIESCMIGLNDENTPKSWLSRKYTTNSPKRSYSYHKSAKGEEAMISELKEIFFCKVDKMTLPKAFKLEANSFDGVIQELREKFEQELLQSKVNLTDKYTQDTDPPILNAVRSSSAITNPSGTQIRFNYNQPGNQNRSNISISFNNRQAIRPVSANRSVGVSIEKPKVNFSYQKNITPITSPPSNGPQTKELQNTHCDSGTGNSKILAA